MSASEQVIDLTNDSESVSDHSHTQASEGNAEPLDDAAQTHLQAAIALTPEERLREVLSELVVDDPTVGRALFKVLVTVRGPEPPGIVARNESNQITLRIKPSQPPMLVPTWATCANCNETYNTGTARVEGECRYHSGELEADEDAFEDHDEYCHGPIDTESNRKDFPEKFFWNCCDNDGTSPGCEEDIHKPSVPRKKRRYE
ncbi:hypothetical protein NLI96_g444 [Meripilus lineatus]|uniref:C2H2-type domain-containing protein n=1 Tax=Meripilus lineatus TaxID=2056292 RepID=A0AAD5VDQ7_9APHY|nr:hypothetical protein NLI96_g444 [Physisporinus lineatus]